MHPALVAGSLVGAAAMLAWRMRETRSPVTAKKLLLPPLGMSTGFAMFLFPPARVPLSWALAAFAFGALVLSFPLLHTSKLERRGDDILMERSKFFLWILLGLLAVRFVLRGYVEQLVSPIQTGGLFFIAAFGMLLPWRVAMFLRYRQLKAAPSGG
jgi:membrane protein CcdC involved in cytochrome C biogenesis